MTSEVSSCRLRGGLPVRGSPCRSRAASAPSLVANRFTLVSGGSVTPVRKVVEADEREVAGDRDAERPAGAHHAVGVQVVAAHDRGDAGVRPVRPRVGEGPLGVLDRQLLDLEVGDQRAALALEPVAQLVAPVLERGLVARDAHVRDRAVFQRREVLGQAACCGGARRGRCSGPRPRPAGVEDHGGRRGDEASAAVPGLARISPARLPSTHAAPSRGHSRPAVENGPVSNRSLSRLRASRRHRSKDTDRRVGLTKPIESAAPSRVSWRSRRPDQPRLATSSTRTRRLRGAPARVRAVDDHETVESEQPARSATSRAVTRMHAVLSAERTGTRTAIETRCIEWRRGLPLTDEKRPIAR